MKKLGKIVAPVLAMMMLCILSTASVGQEESEGPDCTAYIAGIVGTVEYSVGDDEWEAAELDMCLEVGDMVRTAADSAVAIQIEDQVQVRVNANSEFTVSTIESEDEEAEMADPNQLDLEVGELWAEFESPEEGAENFRVNTPSGVVAVRGTEFNVAVDEEGKAKINVLDGLVEVFNDMGSVLAEAGLATELLEGQLPIDPFEFDIDAFRGELEAWKDQISIGAVKEQLMNQIEEKKDEIKNDITNTIKKPKLF